jgi:putative ABC transport system substrate-binding protein
LAADLVRRRVAVIATPGSSLAAIAAKAATSTVPIVFGNSDPVELGLVASLNRPGGNVTGIASMLGDLVTKRLGLLHELVPRAARFAVLLNPENPNSTPSVAGIRKAASTLGRTIEFVPASDAQGIVAGFATLVERRIDALLVEPDPFFGTRRIQLALLAARHAIPAVYGERRYAEFGGLMSYGPDLADQFRQVGIYTGRILKGEKPADLPVQQPTKFELLINLQTAVALGFEIPPTLLALANEVIE